MFELNFDNIKIKEIFIQKLEENKDKIDFNINLSPEDFINLLKDNKLYYKINYDSIPYKNLLKSISYFLPFGDLYYITGKVKQLVIIEDLSNNKEILKENFNIKSLTIMNKFIIKANIYLKDNDYNKENVQ